MQYTRILCTPESCKKIQIFRAKHPFVGISLRISRIAHESEKSFVFNFVTKPEELAADPRKYKK